MVATGTAILGAAVIGAVGGLATMGIAAHQQDKAKQQEKEILEKLGQQNMEHKAKVAQFLQAQGYGQIAQLM